MNKEAIQEVQDLTLRTVDKPLTDELTYTYDGSPASYTHKVDLTQFGRTLGKAIEPFRAAKLEVATLTGFVDAIKAGVTGVNDKKIVHVQDPFTVAVKTASADQFGVRNTLLVAKYEPLNAFQFDSYYNDPQKFIIALQVAFYTNEDALYLQNLASHLDASSSVSTDDDGINQTVRLKVGEVRTTEGKIRPRLKLIPRTTFDEAAPVVREFLIRLKQSPEQTPSIAIFAVDGNKWKGESMAAIKTYLAKHLEGWHILA